MPPKALQCFNCGTNGHGVRECPDISCHYCHGMGHIVDNCPKKRHRSPVCSDTDSETNNNNAYARGSAGKGEVGVGGSKAGVSGEGLGLEDPLPSRCFTCKEYGHRSESCAQTVCRECGKKGHIARQCPSRRDTANPPPSGGGSEKEKKCFFCKRRGHHISDCDLKRLYPNEGKLCYMCLKPGHHANECTNEAVCHLCGESGHVSGDCPNRNCSNCHAQGHATGRCPSVRCYRCNENGHMANECDDEGDSATAAVANNSTNDNNNNNITKSSSSHLNASLSAAVKASGSSSTSPAPNVSLPAHLYDAAQVVGDSATASGAISHHLHPHLQQVGKSSGLASVGAVSTQTSFTTTASFGDQSSALGVASFGHTYTPSQSVAPTYSNPQPHGYTHPQGPPPPFPGSSSSATLTVTSLPPIPPVDESSALGFTPQGSNGRVCVLIDGAYFESCVKQQAGGNASDGCVQEFTRVRLALQHALLHIGNVFGKTPYGFWFDMDPSSLVDFVEQEFSPHLRESTLKRIQTKHVELISHMCGGRGLSNVVTRLVGKIRHRTVVGTNGFGTSWMPAGVDVAIATSIVECFESKQFNQVVLLSGDGALCPAVDFCNTRRQGCSFESATKAPVRVCGTLNTMDPLFGARQELVDFLPRIFLDASEHVEEGRRVPFPIANAFK